MTISFVIQRGTIARLRSLGGVSGRPAKPGGLQEMPGASPAVFSFSLCGHAHGGSCGGYFLKLLLCFVNQCQPVRRMGWFYGVWLGYYSLLHVLRFAFGVRLMLSLFNKAASTLLSQDSGGLAVMAVRGNG